MKIHVKDTTADGYEWLADRVNYIGCSEVAAIMGLSPYSTPAEVWARKRGILDPFGGNYKTRRGSHLEEFLCAEAADELGYQVTRPKELLGHDDIDHFRTNLDGWIDDCQAHLECKDSSWRSRDYWMALKNGEVTQGTDVAGYWIQVQAAMSILKTDRCFFAVDIEKDFHLIEVERDKEAIRKIERSVIGFWHHVESGECPPLVNRSDLNRLRASFYAKATNEATAEIPSELLAEYAAATKIAAQSKKQADRAKDKIEIIAREAGARTVDFGGGAKGKFTQPKPRFDAKKFQFENPDLAREYLTESKARFTISGAKAP